MACGCVTPTQHSDLQSYVDALTPSALTDLTNTVDVSGSLYRSGGTGGTVDAFGYTTNYVDGTGCGYWEYRQFFDDLNTNNEIFIVLRDEFNNVDTYGHIFSNFFGLQRVGIHHGTTTDSALYYGPLGDPNEVGWTVGFRFAIYYYNGTCWLWQNAQGTTDTNDFEPTSLSTTFTGLPTDRRWRVEIFVVPAIAEGAHSPLISETILAASDVCAEAVWELPALEWTASASAVLIPTPGVSTQRFDAGLGSAYYLVPPVIDSGNELRSKVVKSMRATGRKTNVSMKAYGYDLNDAINTTDLEEGINASTRAQALPDSEHVTQSQRKQINVPNAVLSTVRLAGDDTGQENRDEIHEIVVEQADQGTRR